MKNFAQNIVDQLQKEIDSIKPKDGKKYLPVQLTEIKGLRKAIHIVTSEARKI